MTLTRTFLTGGVWAMVSTAVSRLSAICSNCSDAPDTRSVGAGYLIFHFGVVSIVVSPFRWVIW